jgi:3-hydroxymyristoyl/3-hydroxydecanoyl-(acyl carrier protein) dehydratase
LSSGTKIEIGGELDSAEFSFSKDHPSIAGHFPGSPIVPGALLLMQIQQMIHDLLPGDRYVLRSAKFLRPVRPGESLRVFWEKRTTGEISFLCEGQDEPALTGMFEIRNASSG